MQKILPNGLILRNLSEGVETDRQRLPDFNASINTEGMSDHAQDGMRLWVRRYIDGVHPTVTLDDLFVVVDPAKDDMIVSATLLIPQTWRYAGIPLKIGQPELVATHRDYRSRGLVRALFGAVHERSAALGHDLLGITGIPHYYRQFGYTMTVDLDDHAIFHLSAVEDFPADAPPAMTLRPATPADIPTIRRWNDRLAAERLLSDDYDEASLQYDITGRVRGYYPHTEYLIMVDANGLDVGYLVVFDSLKEDYQLRCPAYVVGEETSYLAAFRPSMQALRAWAKVRYGRVPEMVYFYPGLHETVDRLIERSPSGYIAKHEYGWYLRVPDLKGFLTKIAPVLEKRLENSGAHRYTGTLDIGFGLTGIRFTFERGRLANLTDINGDHGYHAEFPWHMFLNVVFGHRTVDELSYVLPDIYADAKGAALLSILFPKQKSWLRGGLL